MAAARRCAERGRRLKADERAQREVGASLVGVVAEAVGVLLVERIEHVVAHEHELHFTPPGEFDGEVERAIEQKIGRGRIGREVSVRVEARLLRHIDAREGERGRGHILLARPQGLAVSGREAVAIGGHEGQPAAAGKVAPEDPFGFCHESERLDGLVGGFDVAAVEPNVVLVVDEFGVLAARVVVETVFTLADVVVDVAVDALIEHTRFDGEAGVAPLRAEHRLVAAFALQMAVAHHPVGAFLQPDGVELVDVGWPPRPAHVGASVPLFADLVVGGERGGEIAVEFEVVVVGVVAQTRVAVDRHHAEVVAQAEGGLQAPEGGFVQGETAHGERGEVGHKGRLFRAGIVEILLVGVGQSGLGGHVPKVPLGVPRGIELEGLENQVLHRNPTPLLFLAVLEFLAQVLLERGHEVEPVVGIDAPFEFALHGEVLRLLEGGLDVVGEGAQGGGIGTAGLEALHELVEVGDLRSVVDAAALVVDARKQGCRDVIVLVAEHGREGDVVVARVVEDIVGRVVITSFGVVAVHASAPAFVARFEGAAARHAARVGVVAHVDRTFHVETRAVVGQGGVVEEHHSAHGAETVANALRALHHFDHARAGVVDFGRVVGTPTLAFEAHTVVHQEDAAGVHALNHGLGDRAARADGADAGDGFEQFGQRHGAALLNVGRFHCGRLLQHGGVFALGGDHGALHLLTGVFQGEVDAAVGGDGDRAHEFVTTDVGDFHVHTAGVVFQTDGALPVVVGDGEHTLAAHGGADEGFVRVLARDGEMQHSLCLRRRIGGRKGGVR